MDKVATLLENIIAVPKLCAGLGEVVDNKRMLVHNMGISKASCVLIKYLHISWVGKQTAKVEWWLVVNPGGPNPRGAAEVDVVAGPVDHLPFSSRKCLLVPQLCLHRPRWCAHSRGERRRRAIWSPTFSSKVYRCVASQLCLVALLIRISASLLSHDIVLIQLTRLSITTGLTVALLSLFYIPHSITVT